MILAGTNNNDANYYNSAYTDPKNYLTPVGTFSASPGPYGTYDMGGELFQWNEGIVYGFTDGPGRVLRGGTFDNIASYLSSSDNILADPTYEMSDAGFRVASSEAVPEPGSAALLHASAAGLLAFAWRRRTHGT